MRMVPDSRFGHTLTSVSNDAFLLFGGATYRSPLFSVPSAASETFRAVDTGALENEDWVSKNDLYICLQLEAYEGKDFQWFALNAASSPSCRAYHAATAMSLHHTTSDVPKWLVLFGGKTNAHTLCTNDLYCLDLHTDAHSLKWIHIACATAPMPRYGHSLVYVHPHLILFGGNNGKEVLNDLWVLRADAVEASMQMENPVVQWKQVNLYGAFVPPKRAFHSAYPYYKNEDTRFMIIYGGMVENDFPRSRLMTLQQNKNGQWYWRLLPVWVKCLREKRSHHSMTVVGDKVVIIGGLGSNEEDDESGRVAVYDIKSYVFRYYHEVVPRYNHQSWYSDGSIYCWGGFSVSNASLCPSNEILGFSVLDLLSVEELKELSQLQDTQPSLLYRHQQSRLLSSVITAMSTAPLETTRVTSGESYTSSTADNRLSNTLATDFLPVARGADERLTIVMPQAIASNVNVAKVGHNPQNTPLTLHVAMAEQPTRASGRPMRASASMALEAFKKLPADKMPINRDGSSDFQGNNTSANSAAAVAASVADPEHVYREIETTSSAMHVEIEKGSSQAAGTSNEIPIDSEKQSSLPQLHVNGEKWMVAAVPSSEPQQVVEATTIAYGQSIHNQAYSKRERSLDVLDATASSADSKKSKT